MSLGGYFAHHALAADDAGIESGIFEQVAPDLLLPYRFRPRWPWDVARAGARLAMPLATRWFPAHVHAPHLRAERILYVSGDADHGIPIADAQRLARAAGPRTRHHVVRNAGHLEAWKKGGDALRADVEHVLRGRPV